jgi:hypothetical protein
MSMNPQHLGEVGSPAPDSPAGSQSVPPGAPPVRASRRSRLWTICFIVLAFELGGFLILFPWREAWHLNHFPTLFPGFFDIWDSPYFRGAVSGLGVVDLLIATSQSIYLFRSSRTS